MKQAADLYAEKEKDLHIFTMKGRPFYISKPTFDLQEIAHATGMQCRYTGHTRDFYSVAEHGVLVSRILDHEGQTEFALEGLMHDAHEAYVSDIASPWKVLIPQYRQMEEGVESKLREAFGLPATISTQVKRADWLALFIEALQVLPPGTSRDWLEPEEGMKQYASNLVYMSPVFQIRYLTPQEAQYAWLDRYHELKARQNLKAREW